MTILEKGIPNPLIGAPLAGETWGRVSEGCLLPWWGVVLPPCLPRGHLKRQHQRDSQVRYIFVVFTCQGNSALSNDPISSSTTSKYNLLPHAQRPDDHHPRPPHSLHGFLHPRHLHRRRLRRLLPRPSLLHRSLLLETQTLLLLLIRQIEIEIEIEIKLAQ